MIVLPERDGEGVFILPGCMVARFVDVMWDV